MSLEISGLIAYERVRGGMRPVEAVSRKRREEFPNFHGCFFVDVVFDDALYQFFFLFVEKFLDFLADGFPKSIGFGERKAGKVAGNPHHLLLIDADAVSLRKNRFEAGVKISYFFPSEFPVDVHRNKFHRSRPVKRNHDDDVFQFAGFQLLEVVAHAGRFELEDAGHFAAFEKLKSFFVVERQFVNVDIDIVQFFYEPQSFFDDGEVLKSQKIDFEEAQVFDAVHFELGDNRLVSLRRPLERYEFGQGVA